MYAFTHTQQSIELAQTIRRGGALTGGGCSCPESSFMFQRVRVERETTSVPEARCSKATLCALTGCSAIASVRQCCRACEKVLGRKSCHGIHCLIGTEAAELCPPLAPPLPPPLPQPLLPPSYVCHGTEAPRAPEMILSENVLKS